MLFSDTVIVAVAAVFIPALTLAFAPCINAVPPTKETTPTAIEPPLVDMFRKGISTSRVYALSFLYTTPYTKLQILTYTNLQN
jgi:hypothetical protein